MTTLDETISAFDKANFLLVDDDSVFAQRFAKALTNRGLIVSVATNVADAKTIIELNAPDYAIVDLNIAGESGLEIIEALTAANPDARSIVLTGYGNLPNTVAAVKSGAQDFLSKPATVEEVLLALKSPSFAKQEIPSDIRPADEVRLKHIHSVYRQCDYNVSETARKLSMHRRTLQRILSKNPVQDADGNTNNGEQNATD